MASGVALASTETLWDSLDVMKRYDVVLMSCEGTDNNTRSDAQLANVKAYADAGGRLFLSHWHNVWVKEGPAPWPSVAKFASGAHGFDAPITVTVDTTFPKGMAFSRWLTAVGAAATPDQLVLNGAEHSVDEAVPALAQRWLYGHDAEKNKPMVQYMTFNTPVASAGSTAQQCGRVVMSDIHVSSGTGDSGKVAFPSGCTSTELTPQEKALAFMLFDLTSCVHPDGTAPPIIVID
jgi:hypothetical protein